MTPQPKDYDELTQALRVMMETIQDSLRRGGYTGPPIQARLAGGMAVNYWCGTRYTRDVDADFSTRILLPPDLHVAYRKRDGSSAFIYFDYHYNTSLALLHEDFDADALPHRGLRDIELIDVRVLTPVDLAVSKLARFSENDRRDIYALAGLKLIDAGTLRRRAEEAMRNFVGNLHPLRTTLDRVCRDIDPHPDFERINRELHQVGVEHPLVAELAGRVAAQISHPLLVTLDDAVRLGEPAALEVKATLEALASLKQERGKSPTRGDRE